MMDDADVLTIRRVLQAVSSHHSELTPSQAKLVQSLQPTGLHSDGLTAVGEVSGVPAVLMIKVLPPCYML